MPHCAPPHSRNASCNVANGSRIAKPSMVTIRCAGGLQDGNEATIDERSIHQNGAGAALAFAAAFFRARQAELDAEDVEQALHRIGA